MTNTETAHQL